MFKSTFLFFTIKFFMQIDFIDMINCDISTVAPCVINDNLKTCCSMGLYHPLDGGTNIKYKLLCFLTPYKKISKKKPLAFNEDRCCHLTLCLWLILFHCTRPQNQTFPCEVSMYLYWVENFKLYFISSCLKPSPGANVIKHFLSVIYGFS